MIKIRDLYPNVEYDFDGWGRTALMSLHWTFERSKDLLDQYNLEYILYKGELTYTKGTIITWRITSRIELFETEDEFIPKLKVALESDTIENLIAKTILTYG